jgi:hypothetical protein
VTQSGSTSDDTVSVTAPLPNATFSGPDTKPQDGYLEFSRTNDSSALDATVSYAGSTAVAGTDYSSLPTQISFDAGQQVVVEPVAPTSTDPDISSLLDASVTGGSGYDAGTGEAQLDLVGEGPTVTLGNGSGNIILQGSSDGTTNLQQLHLNFPKLPPAGATVTLSLSSAAQSDVVLWTTEHPEGAEDAFDLGAGDSVTWQAGDAIPSIWVGAIKGSAKVGDIYFTLSETDPGTGGGPPVASQNTTKPATAIRIFISDATGADLSVATQHYTVGQVANLQAIIEGPASLPVLSYQWTVPGNVLAGWHEDAVPPVTGPMDAYPIPLSSDDLGLPFPTGTSMRNVRFFWVSAAGGAGAQPDSETDDVKLRVNVSGPGGTLTLTTDASFQVSEPAVDSVFKTTAPSATSDGAILTVGLPPTFIPIQPVPNHANQYIPGTVVTGNLWEAAVDDGGVGGNWKFLSLIQASNYKLSPTAITEEKYPGVLGLDGVDPYGQLYGANGTVQIQGDAPFFQTSAVSDLTSFSYNEQFVTYIMYRPTVNSQWVPLQKVDWGWRAKGVLDANFFLVPSTVLAEGDGQNAFVDTTVEPTWTIKTDVATATISQPR